MQKLVSDIIANEGDLDQFSLAYKSYGLHVLSNNSVRSLEWAPAAQQLYLKGDFSESQLAKQLANNISVFDVRNGD